MRYKLYKESNGYKVQVYETGDLSALVNMTAHAAALYYASDRAVPKFSVEAVEEVHDE